MNPKQESLAGWGLRLDRKTLERLRSLSIYTVTAVKRVHQNLANRYAVRGEESGGATAEVGRYVTFASDSGEALPSLQLVESLGGNGRHAIVIAPVLVRVELFRVGTTCQLMVTKHELVQREPDSRPVLRNTEVFHGVDGWLDTDRGRRHRPAVDRAAPRFLSLAGEERRIPAWLLPAVTAASQGASCVRCGHAHYSLPPSSSDGTDVLSGGSMSERTDTRNERSNVTLGKRSPVQGASVGDLEDGLSQSSNSMV